MRGIPRGHLTGKVAIISGAARGMGASHARLFVEESAKVVVGDLLDDACEQLVAELGESAVYTHLDVRNPDDWNRAVAKAVDTFGSLSVLVNNAGIVKLGDIETHTLADWQLTLDINLTGGFLGMQAAAPELKKSGNGAIVNVLSTAGLQGYAGQAAYTATKFAIRGLTKSVALDLAPFNVRVNSVHPGVVRTPMTEGANLTQDQVATHRIAEPIAISRLVLFLASDDPSFSTGAEFIADGGELAGLAGNAVFG